VDDADLRILLKRSRAAIDQTRGRIEGIDAPLPEPSEIDRATRQVEQAREESSALQAREKAAEAELEFARTELQRARELQQKDAASLRALQRAQRDHQVAEARLQAIQRELAATRTAVKAAELQVQVLKESMDDTEHLHKVYGAEIEQTQHEIDLIERQIARSTVESPVDGVILEKHVDSRMYLQSGSPLLTIGVLASIEVRSDILSDQIARVQVGQKVYLTGPALDERPTSDLPTGRVRKIYPSGFEKVSSLGVRQQRVPVLVAFENSGLGLRPGSELDVQIVVDRAEDALLVPSSAIVAAPVGQAVFLVQDGKARLRPVQIGLTGQEMYQVTDGLAEGDRVIVRPPTDLQHGASVTDEDEE
jgi:HlyD family secretion protein